jgi:hypothetical protein
MALYMLVLIFILLIVPWILFWGYQFVQLMHLKDEDVPGTHDKLIWAALFLLLPPIAPFVFRWWHQGYVQKQERRPEGSTDHA